MRESVRRRLVDAMSELLSPPLRSYEHRIPREVRELWTTVEKEHPWVITPRHFDLSPYFDVLKFNSHP